MDNYLTKEKEDYEAEIISGISKLEEEVKVLFSNSKPFNFKKNHQFISSEKLYKTTVRDPEKTLKSANKILNNNIVLMESLEVLKFSNKINWNYEHHNSANTYKLYIQCLNFISTLTDAYLETKEKVYLLKAYEILLSWIVYIKTDNNYNKFKWVDHTVSNRVINIIYFLNVVEESNDIEIELDILGKILIEHGRFLENDKHYRPNNHGIMMDRAIILLSVYMAPYPSSNRWFSKGEIRLLNALYRDLSYKGVHLENSPSYHLVARRMFKEIKKFLEDNKVKVKTEIIDRINLMESYLTYIIKPDNSLPIIGDTQLSYLENINKNFSSFIDTHAGIAILQKEHEPVLDSTWISFVCGYGSQTHKHKDDLSITLYHNGEDILQDSGRYNYDRKDKIRQYLLSPNAHSTVTISGKTYEISNPEKNKEKIQITDFLSSKELDIVKGRNYAYENSEIERKIAFLKNENIIILLDTIKNQTEEVVNQIFNLDNNVKVRNEKSTFTLVTDRNEINIKQHYNDLTNLTKIIKPSKEPPQSLISKRFGKVENTSQLVYEQKEKEVTFLTSIDLNYKSKRELKLKFNSDKSIIEAWIDGKEKEINI